MNEVIKKIYHSPFFILYILIVANVLVACFYIKTPFTPGLGDSATYYNAMSFLQGQTVNPVPYNRLLTSPLMLNLSIFFSYFTGNLYWGMMVVNLIIYSLFVYVFYQLVLEVYNDKKVALLSSFLVLADYAMFTWGTSFLVDMGGWFFFVLTTLFAVKYYKAGDWVVGRKFYFFSILSASVGALFKEYGVLGLISLACLIIVSKDVWQVKIKKIIGSGLIFLIIPVLYHLWFYFHYHYSYFDWYYLNYYQYYAPLDPVQNTYNLRMLVKVLGWVYLVGWPIFLAGLWFEKKFFIKERLKILTALLPASLVFLLWPGFDQRVAFILVPWLALISGFGLSQIKNKYIVTAILLFYILVNYNIQHLLKIINLPF